MLGIALMLALWVRDNIPNKIDVAWLKAGGGLFGGASPDAGRFNAGQKMVFWIVDPGRARDVGYQASCCCFRSPPPTSTGCS